MDGSCGHCGGSISEWRQKGRWQVRRCVVCGMYVHWRRADRFVPKHGSFNDEPSIAGRLGAYSVVHC